jgi:hypothetical protein
MEPYKEKQKQNPRNGYKIQKSAEEKEEKIELYTKFFENKLELKIC